jgi:hypothetical protein
MADTVSEIASKTGISPEAVHKGLGLILALLKSKLPAESFEKVSAAVPEADQMMAAVEDTGEPDTGGVVGAVKGVIGKILGGGGTDALLAHFGQHGISPDQIHSFIPKVMEFLKGRLPENVWNQINNVLPTPQEATH